MSTIAEAVLVEAQPAPLANHARFDTLVRDYERVVFRYLVGMLGDVRAAEDCTQEVFLRAWRGIGGLRDDERARSWLFAIAANTARTHRAMGSQRPEVPLNERRGPTGTTDNHRMARSDHSLHVRRILASMSEEDRQIVMLVGLEGLTAVEAAEALGLSVPAARKRWQRACARFRERLQGGAA